MTSPARPCPICRRARAERFAPFCSERCRDRDLARWFSDSYAVPGERVDPEQFVDGGDGRGDSYGDGRD